LEKEALVLSESALADRLRPKLEFLYGEKACPCVEAILEMVRRYRPELAVRRRRPWDQRDVVLITYADQIRSPGQVPLAVLGQFLQEVGLEDRLTGVHLLPFFPYSSDDGFSVIDYRQVDPAAGTWSDVHNLGARYRLMFDLVLNHVSRQSRYFQLYQQGQEPYVRFFLEKQPGADYGRVVRPRTTPLFTPVPTNRGVREVWTTFSADQIDWNYSEPAVLLEMIDVFLFYLAQGADIIRLDAIAYLWKTPGTSCIHLPQTHTVVKILRDIIDAAVPGVLLLTETNVPHEENISYFGDGDEAHMVYLFSLPPLLLDALLSGDGTYLNRWLADWRPPPAGCMYFVFTASHDGVGVRALERLLPSERLDRLLASVRTRGGLVSFRRTPDGTESPYELNISYFSALGAPAREDPEMQVRRFLASQALMLSVAGIPGLYFHSLMATPNDLEGVRQTGQARSINRHKYTVEELRTALADPTGPPRKVLEAFRRMLAIRATHPAFHPQGEQEAFCCGHPGLIGLVRTSPDRRERIVVLANLTDQSLSCRLPSPWGQRVHQDLLAEENFEPPSLGPSIPMAPYQVRWMTMAFE